MSVAMRALTLLAGVAIIAGCQPDRANPDNGMKGMIGGGGGADRTTGNTSDRRDGDTGNRSDSGGSGGKPDDRSGSGRTSTDTPPPARGDEDRRVNVVNNATETILFVRGSPTGDQAWGADRIPTTTLQPGGSAIVDFDDGNGECRYDLQITFTDQTTRERRDVDICQVREWTITAEGESTR